MQDFAKRASQKLGIPMPEDNWFPQTLMVFVSKSRGTPLAPFCRVGRPRCFDVLRTSRWRGWRGADAPCYHLPSLDIRSVCWSVISHQKVHAQNRWARYCAMWVIYDRFMCSTVTSWIPLSMSIMSIAQQSWIYVLNGLPRRHSGDLWADSFRWIARCIH